jgi:hypothetical protein
MFSFFSESFGIFFDVSLFFSVGLVLSVESPLVSLFQFEGLFLFDLALFFSPVSLLL